MDNFLKQSDALANLINEKALLLYKNFASLSADQLELSEYGVQYFRQHHSGRLFFSIQTSAELLYRSLKLRSGSLADLILMDYGAGIGSMFLLAKMIGIGCVVYNDYNPVNLKAGKSLCTALNISVDHFIVGDHTQTFQELIKMNISCDIILSRNVVEHIYDLKDFYAQARRLQPKALIYFSTTANYHNPGNRIYHQRIHRKYEINYLEKRKEIIRALQPAAKEEEINLLGNATRGLAMEDLENAVKAYFSSKRLPDPSQHYSNTANPENGIWAEHLIKKQDYRNIIEPLGYQVQVIPAFWDTHYAKSYKRFLGKTMNVLTHLLGPEKGLWFTAFIYVVAMPVDQ